MKLVNTGTQGNHAVVGGRISRQEINDVIPVIVRIILQCGIVLNEPIAKSLLGSSGSNREFCGDIDIAVPVEALNHGKAISKHKEVLSCSQHGNVISFVIAIPNGEISPDELRNGFVQVDLIGGDFEWLHQFYYSCPNSKFKGAHRNLLISAYLSMFRKYTYQTGWDLWKTDSGPIFSQKNGLFDRHRERIAKKDGTPYKDKFALTTTNHQFSLQYSATTYFSSLHANAFDSFENLVSALEYFYEGESLSAIYDKFFGEYLSNTPHLNTDAFPWESHPILNASRLKSLKS